MEIQDYILVHGKIINIKNNVDDKYIWFDISKDEYYKDKDGHMKNNPSFFSARISKILSNKNILSLVILILFIQMYLKDIKMNMLKKLKLKKLEFMTSDIPVHHFL
jgi:hypothetical protein